MHYMQDIAYVIYMTGHQDQVSDHLHPGADLEQGVQGLIGMSFKSEHKNLLREA